MGKFVLTKQAIADIDDIWGYVSESNIQAADRLLDAFESAMYKLGELPKMGSTRPQVVAEEIRFWVVGSYLIVYHSAKNPIQILRVLHSARDIEHIL